ncbi:DUF2797 domain-containing protein [Halovivax gelatinilyticus]|uniref:DUF2797 domain-containing protein n=1 Tax=Halovivax gelatinilyticus TaxID=2961597 RepID=UPI0020CA6641|nr:DUF2797 domain-containing protein [Halovivax gelatinilyticus]
MQLVGYEPTARGPALLESDDGSVSRRAIEPGDRLEYALGARRCAGVVDRETGRHVACDRTSVPYCDDHASTWVCARCTGTCLKDEMDCFDDHAVYLAGFAPDVVKVGVTRLERLETRLREQGADRGAHVHTVSNGRIARELEAEIATRHTDRVGTDRKVAGLAETVDEAIWTDALEPFDVIAQHRFDYGFDLEVRPVRETIASGAVVGIKGRVLVVEQGGTNYAVDMRDLVGYHTDSDGSEKRLQTSLDSFGTSE